MLTPSAVEELYDRPHNAGWSVGEVATTTGWLVTGSNGENVVRAAAPTQAEAWRLAAEQAAAVGMLGR